MRTLNRNKKPVWYATFVGKTMKVDANGHKTGEYDIEYSDPVFLPMNCSYNRKYIANEPYGVATDYEVTLVTDKIDCPIDETSVIWVGADPAESHFTHTVLKVAKTLNSITYVVKEVG